MSRTSWKVNRYFINPLVLQKAVIEAYKEYYKDDEGLKDKEPTSSDEANYPFLKLMQRFMNEKTVERGGQNAITNDLLPIAFYIQQNPKILEFINQISLDYLQACINQPVTGLIYIANLVDIALRSDLRLKLQATKSLIILDVIKESAIRLSAENSEVELFNAMSKIINAELIEKVIEEINKKSTKESFSKDEIFKEILKGIPRHVYFEGLVKDLLTKKNIDDILKSLEYIMAMDEESLIDRIYAGSYQYFWAFLTVSESFIAEQKKIRDESKQTALSYYEENPTEYEADTILGQKCLEADEKYQENIILKSRANTLITQSIN